MPRKEPTKVYLSSKQEKIADRIGEQLGMERSEVLRLSLMIFANHLTLLSDAVHGKLNDIKNLKVPT